MFLKEIIKHYNSDTTSVHHTLFLLSIASFTGTVAEEAIQNSGACSNYQDTFIWRTTLKNKTGSAP